MTVISQGRRVLEIQAKTLNHIATTLDQNFECFVARIVETKGRVILTGIGKSGIICRKIAATFASTGTPAFFLHPAEAIHGDLGMIVEGDTVIAISNSGETEELVRLLEFIKRQGATLLSITGNANSTLAKLADNSLTFHIADEGCPLGLAPMASTTATLALGDALAAATMEAKGFSSEQFAQYHPGGKLGKRLLQVGQAMREHGHQKPLVHKRTKLSDALIVISQNRLGMTAVDLEEEGLGLISDGDVRRLLQEHGHQALSLASEEVCTRNPKTIREERLAVEALQLMERHKITALIVTDANSQYLGVVHLHDLWKTQMI